MGAYQQLRLECPEYITLLWSLTEIVGDTNTYKDKTGTQSPRQLLAVEERQLADAFAFIASWKDDPNNVMAVCVEERHSPDPGITIRVASNTGDPSGEVDKLQRVALIMMKASYRNIPRSNPRKEMFGYIVEMCMDRILSRLRSRHAQRTRRTIGKICLPTQLLECLKHCAIHATGKKSRACTEKVMCQAKALAHVFDLVEKSLEGESRKLRLMDVLECASQYDVTALSKTLSFNRSLDPTLKSHLPKAVSKLARYYELSQYLINATRTVRHSLFRDIKFVAVRNAAFDPQHISGPFRAFGDLLQENGWQKHRNTPSARISETKYKSRFSDPRATWKVHAEIQILIFYEMTPQPLQPRIISASKLACFCCDLFLRNHGSFCTPGTHGKVYNTWHLPELPEDVSARISPAVHRFVSELRLISIPKAMGRKRACPPPAESAIFVLQPCSSNSTLRQGSIDCLPTGNRVVTSTSSFAISSETKVPQKTAGTIRVATDSGTSAEREASQASNTPSGSAGSVVLAHSKHIVAPSFKSLSGIRVMEREVDSTTTTLIEADSLHLLLSVGGASEKAMSEREANHWSAFSIRLEEIGKIACKEEALQEWYPVIDIGCLEPGQNYTIPVGAAASRKSILLCNNAQQLLLSFVAER